jgi:RNA polymerase sigma-70 factor, ECF subfamily
VTGPDAVREQIDAIYRSDSRIVLATLIRLLGDFDLAEEAVQDAFLAATNQWPADGLPANPRSWLISTGRFKAIDRLRRRARFDAALGELARRLDEQVPDPSETDPEHLEDDRLRLIFTCCHPALAPDAQLAMTMREVCGLTTEEIARAFLTTPSTVAQRIVRAKSKIRMAHIPYEVPERGELASRLEPVLRVVYLVFNEGYAPSTGDAQTRPDLSVEAIRLGRLILQLLPDPEVEGLLGLMLLHESRRAARTSPDGDIILLPDQDRVTWDRGLIAEGAALAAGALAADTIGPYAIQAAIAAVHTAAPDASATDWRRIVELYDQLLAADPSPVVELNRAVAVAMRDGPEAGLSLVDALFQRGVLDDYHLAHAARADLLRQLDRAAEARSAYERALELARTEPERRFLAGRIADLGRFRMTGRN